MMDTHPYERVVSTLRARGHLDARGCKAGPDRARAQCPTHGDARPSLVVTRRDDKVLIRCFAGCRIGDVVLALGLRMADLFSSQATPDHRPHVVASYDYIDVNGVFIAQKIRLSNKAFRWRTPGRQPDSWRWGLHGGAPGLYRLPELIDVHRVFLNEGEKATDLLWALGLPSTCPPAGASSWNDRWSLDLLTVGCRELVILADNDTAGIAHAARVAASAHQHDRLAAKVVRLPGLQKGADAFDWLHQGHTPTELQNVALTVAYWNPDLIEQERLERRRAQTRERVKRHRDRQKLNGCNAANVTDGCNAVNVQAIGVTRNAVTQGERSSSSLQESHSPTSQYVHCVTGKNE